MTKTQQSLVRRYAEAHELSVEPFAGRLLLRSERDRLTADVCVVDGQWRAAVRLGAWSGHGSASELREAIARASSDLGDRVGKAARVALAKEV